MNDINCDVCGRRYETRDESGATIGGDPYGSTLGATFICGRCASEQTPDELAELLGVSIDAVCDGLGIEPPDATEATD